MTSDSQSLSQQGHGFGEGEIGGEDFAAVVFPVEGPEAGAGEGAFGFARQLDDYIRCQAFVLKNLFRGSHVVRGGQHQDGAVRQAGGKHTLAILHRGASDWSTWKIAPC